MTTILLYIHLFIPNCYIRNKEGNERNGTKCTESKERKEKETEKRRNTNKYRWECIGPMLTCPHCYHVGSTDKSTLKQRWQSNVGPTVRLTWGPRNNAGWERSTDMKFSSRFYSHIWKEDDKVCTSLVQWWHPPTLAQRWFNVGIRQRWPNVGPSDKSTLAQRNLPTLAQRWTLRWPNVGPT